ncbi:MAG: hypothetical protein A3G20_01170 [Acidobacteria bacterium RIFCSPLOWO2_12_FULL_59_11]|nr:MAG: hypothetical protein A3G20_01170 [Acidobacteria bacterium RIFCSPLOWO2_12_FULL_59_11]
MYDLRSPAVCLLCQQYPAAAMFLQQFHFQIRGSLPDRGPTPADRGKKLRQAHNPWQTGKMGAFGRFFRCLGKEWPALGQIP